MELVDGNINLHKYLLKISIVVHWTSDKHKRSIKFLDVRRLMQNAKRLMQLASCCTILNTPMSKTAVLYRELLDCIMKELLFQGRKFVVRRNWRGDILLFKSHKHLSVSVECVYVFSSSCEQKKKMEC